MSKEGGAAVGVVGAYSEFVLILRESIFETDMDRAILATGDLSVILEAIVVLSISTMLMTCLFANAATTSS